MTQFNERRLANGHGQLSLHEMQELAKQAAVAQANQFCGGIGMGHVSQVGCLQIIPDTLTLSGLIVDGPLSVTTGPVTFTEVETTLGGTTTIPSGGALVTVPGSTTTLGGTTTIPSGGSLTTELGSVITAGGGMTIPSGGDFTTAPGSITTFGGPVTIPSGGSLTTEAGSTTTFGGPVSVPSGGSLTIGGGGLFTVGSGGTATIGSGGLFVIPTGGAVTTGTVTQTTGNGTTYTFAGAGTGSYSFTAPATFTGTSTFAGPVTVTGTFTFSPTGDLIFPPWNDTTGKPLLVIPVESGPPTHTAPPGAMVLDKDDARLYAMDLTGTTWKDVGEVANDSISNAMLRNSAALSVIGRAPDTGGDPADIVAANDGEVLRRSDDAVGFGQIATDGITDEAVTYAKMQDVSAASRLLGRGDSGAGSPQEISLGSGLSMSGQTLSATGGAGAGSGAWFLAATLTHVHLTDADTDQTVAAYTVPAKTALLGFLIRTKTVGSGGGVTLLTVAPVYDGSSITATNTDGLVANDITGQGGSTTDWAPHVRSWTAGTVFSFRFQSDVNLVDLTGGEWELWLRTSLIP